MKNILVTGGSGFIGHSVLPALLAKKYSITAIGRTPRNPFGQNVRYRQADLFQPLPKNILKGVDAVVHMAGDVKINDSLSDPQGNIERNLKTLSSILESARIEGHHPLIVFLSTDRLYGRSTHRVATESEPPFPLEAYTASKIMAEQLLALYAHLYQIPYIVLRLDSVYGPHQPRSMFISDLIQKMIATNEVETGSLSTRKNFVYSADVAEAVVCALRAPRSAHNQIYNIGGSAASLEDVAGVIKGLMEKRQHKTITLRTNAGVNRAKKAEVSAFTLSTAKAARILKWKPRTSLVTGLSKTIDYFLHL